MLLPLHINGLNLDSGTAVATITGTLDGSTEADIVSGGRTIIITLTNETFVAFNDTIRQAIIDGLDSAQSELLGWNNEVRDKEVVGAVVRDSDTQVTITLTASPLYDITADEVITVTVPGTAVTGASPITATPTLDVSYVPLPSAKGGRKRRSSRRYSVEVDGEFFFFDSISEVESFLFTVREEAEEAADQLVTTPVTPKPPRISVKTGAGNPTTSKVIQREVRKTQRVVTRAYTQAAERRAVDMEISRLMHKKLQDEQDEDDLIVLLLS